MSTTTAVRPFIPSPQQSGIFTWTRTGTGSAFVEAVAGSGKTTTLIEALKLMNGSVAFTAYNKKIADEIREKVAALGMGNRVRVGTFHSFGFNAWRRIHPDVKAGPEAADEKANLTKAYLDRTTTICPNLEGMTRLQTIGRIYSFVMQLVSLAKQRAIGLHGSITDQSLWYAIIDHFDLAYEIEDERLIATGVELAMAALQHHIDIATEIVDFDDMIYQPLVAGIRMWENDWLLVDEAQDTNPARRALARKMLRRNGRAIFVGDRHQAIYGFTGADNDAVDQIVRDFGCVQLPLTVTYRCPKAVVRVANEVVSHIVAHETAPEGQVSELETFDHLFQQGLTQSDAILCRNTKWLVSTAFQLIRRGTACHVEGRDIGAGLLKLVNRWQVPDLDTLRQRLETFREREIAKLVAKGKEQQAASVDDRVETIFVLADNSKSVDELRTTIATMFQDTDGKARQTLTLSTIHKSKGREWNRVFMLGRYELMPSSFARQEWQVEQEYNLIYVGVTRSKSELFFVPLPPKPDDEKPR